ncbi:MAG: mitofilin family membrane protein [Rhodospirillales bacterium]|nr:mitofilin family membrane protein [Rhodospirillales bacterium]
MTGEEDLPKVSGTNSDQAEPPPPARPVSKKGRHLTLFLWTGGLFIVALAGVGATSPLWMPKVTAYLSGGGNSYQSLANRVKVLEEEAKVRTELGGALQDLERDRNKAGGQLDSLMNQVRELEASLDSVRKIVEATTPLTDAITSEESIRRLSERLQSLSKDGDVIETLRTRISKLETDAAKVEAATVDGAPLSKAVADISDQMNAINKRLKGLERIDVKWALTAPATVLAVGQLRETLRTNAPYAKDLASLKAVAGGKKDVLAAIKDLEPYANTGVTTVAELRQKFRRTALRIARASGLVEGDGWLENTVNRLSSMVTVRRVSGSGKEVDVDTILLAAEQALEKEDLEKAVAELGRLSGLPADAAEEWLRDSRPRLQVVRALSALHSHAISLLASVDKPRPNQSPSNQSPPNQSKPESVKE